MPDSVRKGADELATQAPFFMKLCASLGILKRNRFYTAADKSTTVEVLDGLVIQQGPNYAMAKMMQRW